MSTKRLLFMEDLYDFYLNKYKKSTHFSSEKNGEPLVVQVHGKVNFDNSNKDKDGLLPVHLQACHTDLNANGSNIDKKVMESALPSFSNRPILAYIHKVVTDENPEGQWEFYAHNMHKDENGELVYDEYPIGIIPESCNAQLVYDKEKNKTYCEVDGYIFEEYSKASEILEREGECFVSVELSIRELAYDAKSKCLNIEDFWFSGVTILGKTPEGKIVNPGMKDSNIKLADFSAENNSLFENYESKISELQERLNTLESFCDEIKEKTTKGGTELKKENFEEEVTENEEVTETEESEEEVTTPEEESEETVEESSEEQIDDEDSEEVVETETTDETVDETTETETFSKDELFNKLFDISFEDIKYALNALCSIYRNDSEWCYVSQVYDEYFIMQDWDSDKYYKQSYTREDDNIALTGERTEDLVLR